MAKSFWELEEGKGRAATLALELARVNGNLSPMDRREKYARMAESAFAFYRGSAHLYYRDLSAADLMKRSAFSSPDAITWIQGDLHLNNFGAFRDAEMHVVFDLNDFDEAWISSYLYDVWRGAASLYLTAQDNGFSDKKAKKAVTTFSERYLEQVKKYRDNDHEHYDTVTVNEADGPLKKFLTKAETKLSRSRMLEKWTVLKSNGRRFDLNNPKLGRLSNGDHRLLCEAVSVYKDHLTSELKGDTEYFKVMDTARRLGAGVGSLGTPRYYALIRGKDDHSETNIILDIKQQSLPSMFPFLPAAEQSRLVSEYDAAQAGRRVIDGQRAMLKDPDPHLGFFAILGRSFSVRERCPFKKSLAVEKLSDFKDFRAMAENWGIILATSHARGDDVVKHGGPDSFEREVLRLTKDREDAFHDEILDFGRHYADQVREDHALFLNLIGAD